MQDRIEDLSALMRAANRGDASAYRRLLGELAPRLRALVRRRLQSVGRGPEDCEDIVQETLLALHLKRHTWDETQPLVPWVNAISHHKLVDALRRRGFRQTVAIDDCEEVLSLEAAPADASVLECAEILDQLSERQRTLVVGMSVEGRSAKEMGERLGMSEGAVRVALHRTLKALAAAVRRDEP